MATTLSADANATGSAPTGGMSLRDLYCAHFQCPAADFDRHLLLQSLHPTLLNRLLWKLGRNFFQADLLLIQLLGEANNYENFRHELEASRRANPPRGLLRRQLKARASSQHLLRVAGKLFLTKNLGPRPTSR